MRISNDFDGAVAAAAAAVLNPHLIHHEQQQQLPVLPLEQQLKEWIGPPHNYQGFPSQQQADAGAADTTGGESAEMAAGAAVFAAAAAAGSTKVVPGLNLPHNGTCAESAALPDRAEIIAVAEVGSNHNHQC